MKAALTLVLDDDPTGIQTVHDVWVYNQWSAEVMTQVFEHDSLAFIQTNSRAQPEVEAVRMSREITALAVAASRQSGRDFRIISRSDSSLRGHYPAEPDAIRKALEIAGSQLIDGVILCFVLPEAGRQTVDNVHQIRQLDGTSLPVADSEFASDTVFGYHHSDLTEYVAEKTKGRIRANSVQIIPLDWLERGNTTNCLTLLCSLTNGQTLIINAITYRHLDVLTAAIHQAEELGKRYVFRTAAAFVKSYAGITHKPLLTRADLLPHLTDGPVLTVVGSHTANTSRQLDALLNAPGSEAIELNVAALLRKPEKTVQAALGQVQACMRAGRQPVLFTSRQLQQAEAGTDPLAVSRSISDGLSAVVRQLPERPRAMIAKGGITSSSIATDGLLVSRSLILGQIRPSIPVVLTDADSRFPALPYVIFPGNTGQPDDLVSIWTELIR